MHRLKKSVLAGILSALFFPEGLFKVENLNSLTAVRSIKKPK